MRADEVGRKAGTMAFTPQTLERIMHAAGGGQGRGLEKENQGKGKRQAVQEGQGGGGVCREGGGWD